MTRRFATWMITHRFLTLGILGLATVFFAWHIRELKIKTIFDDLLPSTHPYITVYKQYQDQLGDSLKALVVLQVKEGDIFNQETLEKATRITHKLSLIPGVNQNQIYSIASRKVKKITVTPDAILTENLMAEVPHSDEEMDAFRGIVRNTRGVYGVWVSRDERSILFTASFISELLDSRILFDRIHDIITSERDANHVLFAAGEPLLIGWVYNYEREMYFIFGVTFITLFCLLYFYFRNVIGVVVPILSTLLGAIWGLGFCGLVGFNLEPLTLVLPLLITARALSHAVQITERYFECYEDMKQVRPACIEAASSILPPGLLGITTDGMGILLIAVAPIPAMQKLAYLCAFWAFAIVFTGLMFTPTIISFFKPPRNISNIVDTERGLIQKILGGIARLGYGRSGVAVLIGATVIAVGGGWVASRVGIGDVNRGSPILWQDSAYNIAVMEMNKIFPGTEELYVIVEGEGVHAASRHEFLKILNSFQRHMEKSGLVNATLSIADLLPPLQRAICGGYPKKEILPIDQKECSQILYLLKGNSAPDDFDRYVGREDEMANVIVWYQDHMGDTIREAIATVNEYIENNKITLAEANVTFKLASGNLGILAAVNEVVGEAQLLNFVLVMSITFLLCSLTYRSFVAALILMVPLNIANLITLSVMKWLNIGLNVNTIPIVSVGVGVGIDYGIYLLSRLCEEYQATREYSLDLSKMAVKTTGKAIFFTATTMIAGVIFWYLLSSLRFQAEMGLLLGIIMFINMLGALLLIPAMVYVFKPKFLGRVTLLLK